MKKMLKSSAALTAFVFSLGMFSSANAALIDVHETKVFNAGVTSSKSAAFKSGHDFLKQLKSNQGFKLQHALGVAYDATGNDVDIQSSHVVVKEFSPSPGVISYRANVQVQYRYQAFEYNR